MQAPPASVLLDTCAALWLMSGDPLSAESRAAIAEARSGIYVSPFTAWEIGTLVAKERIQLTLTPEAWFTALTSLPGVRLAALTPQILLASTALPPTPPADPADRIIAATARAHGHTVITRDRKLLGYAAQGHICVIPC